MEGNATVLIPCCFNQRKATSIATREQFVFAVIAVVPDRADRVNDPFGGQFVAARDFGLAGGATAERAAFRQQLRARRAMNRAVHTATAEQRRVGGIHNRVHALLRDVAFYYGNAASNRSAGHGLKVFPAWTSNPRHAAATGPPRRRRARDGRSSTSGSPPSPARTGLWPRPNCGACRAAPMPSTSVCSGSGIGVAHFRPNVPKLVTVAMEPPVASGGNFRCAREFDQFVVAARSSLSAAVCPRRESREPARRPRPRRRSRRQSKRDGQSCCRPAGRRARCFPPAPPPARARRRAPGRVWAAPFCDGQAAGRDTPAGRRARAAASNCAASRRPRPRAWSRPGSFFAFRDAR